MRRLSVSAGIGMFLSAAVPLWCWGQIATVPLVETGTFILPTGAYSPLPDHAQRVYAFYIDAEGTQQALPKSSDPSTITEDAQALAADFADGGVTFSLGYERVRLGLTNGSSNQISSISVQQEVYFMALSSLVAGTLNLSASFGEIRYRSSLDAPTLHGNSELGYPDFTFGFSADVVPNWRVGGNISPAVGVASPYDGTLTALTQKTGHGDQVVVGFARNTKTDTFGLDGSYFEQSLAADTPRTQDYLLYGAHLFGTVLLRVELEYKDESALVDGARFISPPAITTSFGVGGSWVIQSWVLGLRAAENMESFSNYGNAVEDAKRNDTTTIRVYYFSILKRL